MKEDLERILDAFVACETCTLTGNEINKRLKIFKSVWNALFSSLEHDENTKSWCYQYNWCSRCLYTYFINKIDFDKNFCHECWQWVLKQKKKVREQPNKELQKTLAEVN